MHAWMIIGLACMSVDMMVTKMLVLSDLDMQAWMVIGFNS